MAVTLNDRLDYFGSTVNLAARLEAVSATRPGVVVSEAVMRDPEVAEWTRTAGARAEPFTATIKGFEDEQFELWAVTPPPALERSRAAPAAAPGKQRMVARE